MDGWITIGTKLDTKSFDKQIGELENKLEDLEKQQIYFSSKGMDGELKDVQVEIEKTKNKLIQLNKQKNKLGDTAPIDKMGKSFQNSIKHAGRLVLGIFGIRSAYLALRRVASDLEGFDPQFAANLEYIRYVLTQAIAPVLKWIVNLAGTLLGYIYAILNAWFGIGSKLNLGAEAFKKMKSSAGGVSKSVKEIKRELLGFDEITRLTDQSDTGVSGGAGGVGLSDLDITNVSNLPKWVKWLMDNKQIVLSVLGAIATVLAAIKIADFLMKLKSIFSVLRGMSALKIFGIIGGIAVTIAGIVKTISALINYIKNPSWNNFRDVLAGIETILVGVGIAMVALNAANPVGWITLAAAAGLELATALMKDKAQILSTKKAQEQLNNAMKKTKETMDDYINAIDNAEEAEKRLAEAEGKNKIVGEELAKQVQDGILDYKNMTEAQREVYKAYVNNKNAQQEVLNATKSLNEAKKEEVKANVENALAVAAETGNYDELKQSIIKMYEEGKISSQEAADAMSRAMSQMGYDARYEFMQDIPNSIQSGLNPSKYDSTFTKFKNNWNSLFNGLKKDIELYIKMKFGFSAGGGEGFAGNSGGGRAKGGIFYPSQLPKLALGGIINMPGRGLPYNGAVIGERGAEAVVPLTDSQQMELLGATIGKYITVNANIVNTMNGRVISRELKQIQGQQDFAYNS